MITTRRGLPEDGEYYATMTLLGGDPDVNRRMVYCWPDTVPVCVFNQSMAAWTNEDQKRLDVVLDALNAWRKA